MADTKADETKPKAEDKAPTAEDIRALQSTYDRKLADKDKEIAELRRSPKTGAVDDDIAVREKETALAKEREDFETRRVAWERERVIAEYRLTDADKKELDKMTDPHLMELYALKKVVAATKTNSGAQGDREPRQTPTGATPSERMRIGLEQAFKKFYTTG